MSEAGTATFNHDVKLGDNGKAVFGDADDLQIYHDGTHSYVANSTNTLYLRTGTSVQIENSDGSEDLATFAVDGAVLLYHNGSYKLATDTNGVDVQGLLDVSSKVAVAGGTEATSTDGSIRTEGGISAAKKIYAGTNITLGGNLIHTSDLLIDAGGDIFLDADGGDIKFQDDGTDIFSITNSSSDVQLKAAVQDKDIIFKGNDGGSIITALTLDMSAAGAATFNGNVTINGADIDIASIIRHLGDTDTFIAVSYTHLTLPTNREV